jgi:WD40 repeat protein
MAVFRDQSDLAPGSHLWGSIQSNLDSTRFLILLACPESAASHWVNKEVEHWCTTKGTEQLIVVLTGGNLQWDAARRDFDDTSDALPPALRGRFTEEPFYVDMRWGRDTPDLSLRLSTFRGAVATIAAPIRGTTPSQLEGEDIRQHRRTRLLARGAVAGLVVLGLAASAAALVAVDNRRKADRRTREAVGRQVGLFALDQPIDQIDTAMLLSIAAARLDPDGGPDRFQPGRSLIGKYSRLRSLLYAGTETDAGAGTEPTLSTIRALALSPDSSQVAAIEWTANGSPQLLIWDITGSAPGVPTRSALAPDLFPNGTQPSVRYSVTGEAVAEPPIERGEAPQTFVSTDGRRQVVVSKRASLMLDLTTDTAVSSDVRSSGVVAVDPSGRFVAVGGERLVVWDLDTGERPLSTPSAASALAWSGTCADRTATCRLVTGGRSIDVWEPMTGRQITLSAESNAQAVAISTDGMTIVTAGWGSHVAVWSMQPVAGDDERTTVDDPEELGALAQVARVPDLAAAGSYCDGPMVAVSDTGGRFVVHDPARSSVALCDGATGAQLAATKVGAQFLPLTALAVDDDGSIAVGGAGYVTAMTPDATGGLPGIAIEAVSGQRSAIVDALAVRDGQIAAGIRTDDPAATFGRVLLWNPASGSTPIAFAIDSAVVTAIAFVGRNGDAVVVASNDGAASNDGTASNDGAAATSTLQVWEVATRRRIGAGFSDDGGTISRLTGDDDSIIALHADGTVLRWPLNRDPAQEICAIVGRSLTRAEWAAAADGALRPYPFVDVCADNT